MNLSRGVFSFGLKLSHLLLLSFCWFLSLFSFNSLENGRIMTTKAALRGGGIWVKLCELISLCGCKIHQHYSRKVNISWWRKFLKAWIVFGIITAVFFYWYMSSHAVEKRKETLASMCDERARMLQDQFNVSMNHIQAMSVMIYIFHHGKNPSAIDQKTFARYTDKTSFERPLTSGVAYAVRVLHSEREQFEVQQGWTIKRMDHSEQNPVHEDEYDPEVLEPSPDQDEYAPVIFAQDTVAHVVSVDMLSGKEDRENILRARESGKGVLTAPFRLLKTNRLGVILTFAVYKKDLPPEATPAERIQATAGYLGGIFDIESLVEKLLQQLASKQTILVNVFDTTDPLQPISMYGANTSNDGLQHVSVLNFGDPFRKHEMHCRFKHKAPLPWGAISAFLGILTITLLVGQIIHATVNRIARVEDDYQKMTELKRLAEAADVAKSQFLATVSHEIRTPMNGVLGMLQMLMDTDLDETQQDYVRTARESGKALVSLINEVLDLAKIESGKLELEAVNFDLRLILDDVLSLFSGKSQDKNVELAAYVSDRVPNVLVGDPGRFRQIVTNLVGNSIKFTEKGHIYVTVHLVEEVSAMKEDENDPSNSSLSSFPVVDRRQSWAGFKIFSNQESSPPTQPADPTQITIIVSVEDTGQGIPLEAQARIFNPFIQVGPSITRTHGGTGIGLSISKCLVHLMKGEIGLASSPQIGSTFTFTAVFSTSHSSAINKASVSSEFQGMAAMVVDPKPVRAKVAKYHIERLGIRAEIVANRDLGPSGRAGEKGPTLVFVEDECWDGDLGSNQKIIGAKTFLLSNRMSSTRYGLSPPGGPGPYVVAKPLRASMLAASIQRAMGISSRGNHRNGELRHTSLSNLLRGRRVLVVDDNPVNLRVASGALKKYGADVAHAERGKDAIALLTPPHRFDACFMDIQMPEMDGFEATRRIREIERNKVEECKNDSKWHVPILAMTADVIQATHDECLKCGMDGYVPKPFEAEQLYREISRFFQKTTEEENK